MKKITPEEIQKLTQLPCTGIICKIKNPKAMKRLLSAYKLQQILFTKASRKFLNQYRKLIKKCPNHNCKKRPNQK